MKYRVELEMCFDFNSPIPEYSRKYAISHREFLIARYIDSSGRDWTRAPFYGTMFMELIKKHKEYYLL